MAEWEWPDTQVIKIIDGDTVDVLLERDLGFGGTVTFPVRLRLNRINAPRASSKAGRAATARVSASVGTDRVHVTTIKSYKFGGPDDQLGEYMAEVVLADGRNLSDVLVTAGDAVYWDGTGARPQDG